MDESLQKLAEAAQALHPEPIDFEEIILQAIKSYGNIMRFEERFYTFDYDSIFNRYAEKLGKEKLTSLEKKQAILNAVLDQADEQD